MDTGKDDRRCRHPRGISCQFQTVPGKVRNVLNFSINVKMGENRRIFFQLERIDFFHQIERIFFDSDGPGQYRQRHGSYPFNLSFEPQSNASMVRTSGERGMSIP